MAPRKGHEPKLPVKQLAILAVVRFAEPMALTSVFPYLPEMIQSFGVEKDSVAKWAGLTGAVFSISQSVTAVPWGYTSDRLGRKPAILFGLFSTMVCFIFWGMSTSLPMAIAVRAIQGGSNGNVGIIRTMVAEMVPEKVLQPRAFSLMPLVWSIGSVFGPSFGGFFARPAEQFPDLFGKNEFLKKYPFVLPNLVAAVFFCISILTATLFLKETLESRKDSKDWGLRLGEKLTRSFNPKQKKARLRRRSFVDAEASAPLLSQAHRLNLESSGTSTPDPKTSEIFTYQTVVALISYTFLALHSVAYDQVLPVFLNYPEQVPDEHNTHLPFKFSGGFGLTSDKIGSIFTVYGIACGLIQFLLFPPLCSYFGVLRCYRVAAIVFPVVYVVTPYTSLLQSPPLRYAVFLAILLVKGFAVIVGFPCMTIMLTNSAPSLKVLGTLNGFATTFSGLGRAVGPAMTGMAFTWGVKRGYIITGWWLLAAIAAVGAIPPWYMEEGDGPGGKEPEAEDLLDEAVMDDDAQAILPDGLEGETFVVGEDEEEDGGKTKRGSMSSDLIDFSGDGQGIRHGLEEQDNAATAPHAKAVASPQHHRRTSSAGVVKMRKMSATGEALRSGPGGGDGR